MSTSNELASELLGLMTPLVAREGVTSTALPAVSLFSFQQQEERRPLIYEPCLIIVAQGRKVGYLGDRVIHYDPGQYLVQTLPLPFECETHASDQAPLMAISVGIDPALLSEMVTAMGADPRLDAHRDPLPMASVAMTQGMHEAVVRLLRTLHDTRETAVMGILRVRDVIFEALKGDQGPALRALVLGQGHYSRIVQVLSRLNTDFAAEHSVEALARQANMSLSTFHQYFKQITRTSPVQYLKRLRLIKAQQLLVQDACNVNQAAFAVGYRSVPQFSRDYKRCFGMSPLRHRRQWQEIDVAEV
ncbi:AraC family transcriptional regulator [Litchfieldella qijiaojingensis]|nr:AraC family transcriptional regulator [Halomonas qijiaojingensis]